MRNIEISQNKKKGKMNIVTVKTENSSRKSGREDVGGL